MTAQPGVAAEAASVVVLGKQIYREQCAACHGRALQGQPLWQLADAAAGRRAPAFDQTGHLWQRSDAEVFGKIKFGSYPGAPAVPGSIMPGFRDRLDDAAILATIAYIKASWPTALRVIQATHNAGEAGMPAQTAADWRFPPDCDGASRRVR